MKKIYILISIASLFLVACRFDKGDVPQPIADCVDDTTIHLVNVSMGDNFFAPVDLTVIVGDTIQWTNNGVAPHTVTCNGSAGTVMPSGGTSFDSGIGTPINAGETFSAVIAVPGNYTYICAYHTGMTGTIVVKPRCQ
ncbi:MAG: plastocyanin/azurin family copper-binding protein [Bacteroidota bacterium]|nr:plastocyanin/azurin family copper-binding protein [Bacteroidota bacterium]